MSGVFALAMKDLRLVWRDKLGLFWILGFPILMALFFGFAAGGGGGARGKMKVAIVDEDATPLSKAFVAQMRSNKSVEIAGFDPAGAPEPTREEQLAALEKDAKRLDAASATEGVRRGDYAACLTLKKGFEGSIGFMELEGGGKAIVVGMDPARQAEGGMLQGIVVQSLFESLRSRFLNIDFAKEKVAEGMAEIEAADDISDANKATLRVWMKSLQTFLDDVDLDFYLAGLGGGAAAAEGEAKAPEGDDGGEAGLGLSIEFASVARDQEGQPRSAFDITFPSGILWGLLGCASAFSLSLVVERSRGTYQRLRMTPLGSAQILAGKGLACFIACVATVAFLLAFGIQFFGVRVGNPLGLAAAALCASICFVGVMMFVCVLGKTEASVSGAGWAVFLVWAMFGGGMIPLFMMPSWMSAASDFSPVKWGIYALEGGIWRDFGPMEMLKPCGVLVGIGVGMFGLGWSVLRRADG